MENDIRPDDEIRNAISRINKKASVDAPESNWTGVLGRSESVSQTENKAIATLQKHKLFSVAASIFLVALIGIPLAYALSSGGNDAVKTAKPDKKKIATTVPQTSSSTTTTGAQVSTTSAPQQTTTIKPVATTTTTAPSRPANPSNLQFTGNDIVSPGNPGTYNVYFSWTPSSTPGVKYCVGTTSFGSSQIFPTCTWSYQYLAAGTSTAFGLVFASNTTYQFQVTAIDSNNQKSDTIYLNWQLP